MKKLVLTSLVAVFAATTAHAANVINGDPLYRPGANHFYSVTTVGSESEHIDDWGINEEFGYGITNRLAISVDTSASQEFGFHRVMWDNLGLGMSLRALDMGNWKADVYGRYGVEGVYPDHRPFMDHADTEYTWTVGARAGYTTGAWTIAAHADYNYLNTESFNWNDKGFRYVRAGIDGLYSIDRNWSLIAGVEYRGVLNNTVKDYDEENDEMVNVKVKNEGNWTGTFGVNYNIDTTKFVGLYVKGDMEHERSMEGRNKNSWEIQHGFEFGAKFGIDF